MPATAAAVTPPRPAPAPPPEVRLGHIHLRDPDGNGVGLHHDVESGPWLGGPGRLVWPNYPIDLAALMGGGS